MVEMRKREWDLDEGRTVLMLEPECRDLDERVGADEANVHEVDERPTGKARKLCRNERRAHRANAVYGVHDAHLD